MVPVYVILLFGFKVTASYKFNQISNNNVNNLTITTWQSSVLPECCPLCPSLQTFVRFSLNSLTYFIINCWGRASGPPFSTWGVGVHSPKPHCKTLWKMLPLLHLAVSYIASNSKQTRYQCIVKCCQIFSITNMSSFATYYSYYFMNMSEALLYHFVSQLSYLWVF